MGREIKAHTSHVLRQDLPSPLQNPHTANWRPAHSRVRRTAKAMSSGQINAIASSTPRNQKHVGLRLEAPTHSPSVLVCRFCSGCNDSHSHILKSQVHRECSCLFKMLKTCTSVYAFTEFQEHKLSSARM